MSNLPVNSSFIRPDFKWKGLSVKQKLAMGLLSGTACVPFVIPGITLFYATSVWSNAKLKQKQWSPISIENSPKQINLNQFMRKSPLPSEHVRQLSHYLGITPTPKQQCSQAAAQDACISRGSPIFTLGFSANDFETEEGSKTKGQENSFFTDSSNLDHNFSDADNSP